MDMDDMTDVDEDYERNKKQLEEQQRTKQEEEWRKSNEQFDFQSRFENVLSTQ